MTRGKVVLVPFPFDDLSSSKVRPAVCLCDPVGPHRHIVLAFITSRIPEAILETDILLTHEGEENERMGLRVDSTLRLHRMITVSTSIIRRELGEVPPKIQAEIDQKLRKLFQL